MHKAVMKIQWDYLCKEATGPGSVAQWILVFSPKPQKIKKPIDCHELLKSVTIYVSENRKHLQIWLSQGHQSEHQFRGSELELKIAMSKVNLGSSGQVVYRNELPAVWPWVHSFIDLRKIS